MATDIRKDGLYPWEDSIIEEKVINAKGEYLYTQFDIEEHLWERMQKDEVFKQSMKNTIVERFVRLVLEKGLCSFTIETDPLAVTGLDRKLVRARMFVLPNEQVMTLRKNGFIK